QVLQALADVVRPAQLATVRGGDESGAGGDRERRREGGGVAASLVVRQAEAVDAPTGVLGRQSRQGAGVERMPRAVRGDDDAHLQTGRPGRLPNRVDDELG